MSYAIFRMEKMKSTVIDKCQRHNQRENKNYSNQDIDKSRSMLNYDLVNERKINYRNVIDNMIAERRKSTKALRKDAIVSVECMITSDKEFFERIGYDETKRYFRTALEFMKQEFGEENIVYATVHLDEKTPHMHANFVPLTKDGRLSAKDIVGGKKQLTIFQNKFCKYMQNRGFDVERGISSEQTNLKYKKTLDYKKELYKENEKASRKLEGLEKDIEHLERHKKLLESNIEAHNNIETKELSSISAKEQMFSKNNLVVDKSELIQVMNERKTLAAETEFLQTRVLDLDFKLDEMSIENEKLKKELQELKRTKKEFNDLKKLQWENVRLESSVKAREQLLVSDEQSFKKEKEDFYSSLEDIRIGKERKFDRELEQRRLDFSRELENEKLNLELNFEQMKKDYLEKFNEIVEERVLIRTHKLSEMHKNDLKELRESNKNYQERIEIYKNQNEELVKREYKLTSKMRYKRVTSQVLESLLKTVLDYSKELFSEIVEKISDKFTIFTDNEDILSFEELGTKVFYDTKENRKGGIYYDYDYITDYRICNYSELEINSLSGDDSFINIFLDNCQKKYKKGYDKAHRAYKNRDRGMSL